MRGDGRIVSLDVTWPGGKTVRMTGKLIVIKDDEAYVETEAGNVVGSADTLEYEDEDG